MRLFFLAVVLLLGFQKDSVAQTAATKVPEIAAATETYQKAVAAIRATRTQRVARFRKDYIDRLELLRKEITAAGDLDGVMAVKAELDRLAKHEDPTVAQKAEMTGKLRGFRDAYEREREPINQAEETEKDQALTKYLAELEAVQQQMTKSNRLEKALAIKALREKILEKGEIPAAPVSSNAPSIPIGGQRLDAGLGDKIKAAVDAKSHKNTAGSRPGVAGPEIPPAGALLVGFEVSDMMWEGTGGVRIAPAEPEALRV